MIHDTTNARMQFAARNSHRAIVKGEAVFDTVSDVDTVDNSHGRGGRAALFDGRLLRNFQVTAWTEHD